MTGRASATASAAANFLIETSAVWRARWVATLRVVYDAQRGDVGSLEGQPREHVISPHAANRLREAVESKAEADAAVAPSLNAARPPSGALSGRKARRKSRHSK